LSFKAGIVERAAACNCVFKGYQPATTAINLPPRAAATLEKC
jgi:hypothetical protein